MYHFILWDFIIIYYYFCVIAKASENCSALWSTLVDVKCAIIQYK